MLKNKYLRILGKIYIKYIFNKYIMSKPGKNISKIYNNKLINNI